MLRLSLRSARVLGRQPIAAAAQRQWPVATSHRANLLLQRGFADQKKSEDAKAAAQNPPPSTIDDVGESKAKEIPTPAPPAPPPRKKKGFFRRLRNLTLNLILLSALTFGGGVWYSRINDSFHDFFTEYVPYGEQAVLYLEELEYKKRFPNAASRIGKPRDSSEQVTIPAQSGASWRVADAADSSRRSGTGSTPAKKESQPAKPKAATKTPEPTAKPSEPVAVKSEEKKQPAFKEPEVNEPSRFPPLKPIDLFSLADAKEPVVQELVHMLNDLITVINADGAHGKYGSSIDKAKSQVKKVGGQLKAIKAKVEQDSANEVRVKVAEFDKAATELVSRVEKAMIGQELQWRKEFEEEMEKVRGSYDARVNLLLEREKKLNEAKLENQLLEQAIALKKEFTSEVQNRVEKERESRLGQLDALSAAVTDLEQLTTGWNSVIDSNLQTQQLHVAVEAVRANLETATQPQPFIKELVALKEIAADDAVVNAAIASLNPAAYQRGLFTTPQLIDRFRRVASEVRKASLLPDNAGVASHASSWVLSHVMFKKQGLPEGDDVESILTRTQIFLEEGDLDAAAREVNGLEGWAKTLSKDWLGEVRKVLEVQQALDVSHGYRSSATELEGGVRDCLQALTCMSGIAMKKSSLLSSTRGHIQCFSSASRGYTEALERLSLLGSNRTSTRLFEAQRAPSTVSDKSAPRKDLNADAIPEMLTWLRRAGYTPHDLCRIRHIHVAGTKGKGSVCAYATAILRKYGRVGTFTSPHLLSPRERIAIDGEPVEKELFARSFFEVWDQLTEAARKEGKTAAEAEGPESKPFYFRFMTILAWHIFINQGIRDVVFECGIGGEYDATNVLPAEAVSAAVVSQLGIDHVAMLGDTVEKIAWHKAGVFKRGKKAFTRRLDGQPEVMAVLRSRAEEKGVILEEIDDDVVNAWGGVKGTLKGDFQKFNQALAICAVREHLGLESTARVSLQNPPEEMIEGLKEAKLRGRGETIEDGEMQWCLDGAHTKDSLIEVARWYGQELGENGKAVLIFNQPEREISELLTAFMSTMKAVSGREDIFSHALFTTNDVEGPAADEIRDLAVQQKGAETMKLLASSCQVQIFDNIRDGVSEARRICKDPGGAKRVLVTGSMHLAGGVIGVLEPWNTD
ncbi:unnamed protein product [Clonostachys solani]|uniref:MICOS complex subunit MIC60 n=1 Tax=Clonostachys solani TaxID=160281 RepID=A0A9P0EPW6_9HYPO|nr:unnamed protein product [Clonostachys solani]